MDDLIEAITVMFVIVGLALSPMLFSGSYDSTVVNACKANRYWQTGQTRVICSVEEKKP